MPAQISGRRTAEPGNRRYHVLASDGGVPGVAAFYGTTGEELYELAMRSMRSTWGSYRATPSHTFFDAVKAGIPGIDTDPLGRITVPIPASELGIDLVSLYIRGTDVTLRKICEQHNRMSERREARMPPLTPHMLWHMVVNAGLREETLRLHIGRDGARIDHAPDDVTLPDRSTIFVPYPSPHTSTTIHAVPGSGSADGADTTTAQHLPYWAWTLKWKHLQPIEDLTTQLNQRIRRARRMSRRGAQATLSLGVISQVVGRMKDEGHHHATFDALAAAVLQLQNDAARVLVVEPLRYADPHALVLRRRNATALLEALRDPELALGIQSAFTEPDVDVDHRSIRGQVCLVLLRAYHALARSAELGEAVTDAMKALRGHGDGTVPVAAEGKTGLEVALSVAGGLGGIITNATANLPGPASLAGSVLEMVLAAKLPEVARAGRNASGMLAELRGFVMKVGRISEAELNQANWSMFHAVGRAEARAAVKPLADKVGERFLASKQWGGFMSVLSLFALYSALCDDSASLPRQIVNIVGGEMSAALAVRQFLGSLGVGGSVVSAEAQMVMNGVGTVASILAIVSGILQFYEGCVHDDDALKRSGLLSAGGGAIVLAGYAFSIPGLQAAGVLVLILSAALDNWDAIVEALKNPMARVFQAQVVSFEEKTLKSSVGEAQVASHHMGFDGAAGDPWTTLLASIQRCQDAIAAAEPHLVPLRRNPVNRQFLQHMGFKGPDVGNLMEEVFVPVITPPGMGV